MLNNFVSRVGRHILHKSKLSEIALAPCCGHVVWQMFALKMLISNICGFYVNCYFIDDPNIELVFSILQSFKNVVDQVFKIKKYRQPFRIKLQNFEVAAHAHTYKRNCSM